MHLCMYQCASDPAYSRFLKGIHLLFLWGNSRKLCQKWSDDGLEVSWVPGAAWCDLCYPAALRMAFIILREKDPAWLKKKRPCLWKPRARFDTRGLAIIWCSETIRSNEIWAIPGFRLAKISSFSSPSAQSPSLPFSTPHPQAMMSFIPCNSPVPHSPPEFGLRIQVSLSTSKGTSLLSRAA